MRTGVATLPLHPGKAPRWLFSRMVLLSGAIAEAISEEYGPDEVLRRLSDPFWFQAFACALGFDWHSSGTTTTACGALKIALAENEIGVKAAGGKGGASRKAPEEIGKIADAMSLSSSKESEMKKASRLSAKVDSACVQDGYSLYHHSFFVSEKGEWAVVQQGMKVGEGERDMFGCNGGTARRYHWLSESVSCFVNEPHSAICCDEQKEETLNMVASESNNARQMSVEFAREKPESIAQYFSGQRTLADFSPDSQRGSSAEFGSSHELASFSLPSHHPVLSTDLSPRDFDVLRKAYELQPRDYEELIMLEGMGPKKIRALALLSEVIYGEKASWKDPVKYSFAHGGKDGFPYPVDRKTYDHSVSVLKDAIENAKLGEKEKLGAIRRLRQFIS